MLTPLDAPSPAVRVVRHDADGALSWMTAVCGPHWLKVGRPSRLQFHHSGGVLKGMATKMGVIEYGTDVTIGIRDEAPLNSYSLSLPLDGEQELATGERRVRSDRDTGLIVTPDINQELAIAGNCRKILVAIPRPAMRQVLEELLQRPADAALAFEPSMDAIHGSQAAWWRMVRHMLGEFENASGLYAHSVFAGDLEKALIKGLILAQPNNYSAELQQADGRKPPHYLVKARDFIHAHARDELRLEDIEAAAGVGRSTLFDAFRQHVGLAPMAYLKKFRLEQVRRQLIEDRSGHNVSAIAIDWGFTGAFFGGLQEALRRGALPDRCAASGPSATLKAAEASLFQYITGF